ncbi:MAG TPA: hypothetical protein VMN57_03325 [Anaerolineales bacterium]|nr:hypothetical protein [Anaerolineales bacterium]
MAKTFTMVRMSGLLMLALALLFLSALFILSGTNPVLAGVADTTGPGCVSYVPTIGAARIKVTVRDTESGLDSISVVQTKNIGSWEIPSFPSGYQYGITSTFEVANSSANARVHVRAVDVAGNTTDCTGNYIAP